MKIKYIGFDWHGVFDYVTYAHFLVKLAAYTGLSVPEVREKIDTVASRWDTAKSVPVPFWTELEHLLSGYMPEGRFTWGQRMNIRESILLVDPILPMWELADALERAGMGMFILSDCPSDKAAVIRSFAGSWLKKFRPVFFSCEQNATKHNTHFFTKALDALGNPDPRECLYVDDQEKHIKTAGELGLHTHHFTSYDSFRTFLEKNGIYA